MEAGPTALEQDRTGRPQTMNGKIDMTKWTDDEWDAYVRADAERVKARMKAERDRLRQSN